MLHIEPQLAVQLMQNFAVTELKKIAELGKKQDNQMVYSIIAINQSTQRNNNNKKTQR